MSSTNFPRTEDGVLIYNPVSEEFAELYLKVRKQENRLLNDEVVASLPKVPFAHPHFKEWKMRQDTLKRFDNYLTENHFERALEVGCGNGWFSNWLHQRIDEVTGQDVNLEELRQAARVFKSPKLRFACTQKIQGLAKQLQPDLVVFNASFQYFDPSNHMLDELKAILPKSAEIHVLDTPFYANRVEAENARQRTVKYYSSLQATELSEFYFHHTYQSVKGDWLYIPKKSLFSKLSSGKSPFPWLRITV